MGDGGTWARRVLCWAKDDVHGVRGGERGCGLGGDDQDCTHVLGWAAVML